MGYKYGFSGLNSDLNSNFNNEFNTLNAISLDNLITIGRVINIVLDSSNPLYNEVGQENGIGTIQYLSVDSPLNDTKVTKLAKPLYPNIVNYPLINEIVYLIALPTPSTQNNTSDRQMYYMSPIKIWNHPHHNALPPLNSNLPPSQQKDYLQIEAGSIRRITDDSSEINLGSTFREKSNIHPLQPYEGDYILEGRWGNSIRLGSTVNVSGSLNNWSTVGNNGDPILIIRNGQSLSSTDEGWVLIDENISNDISSIYLTSTQNLPFTVSSVNDYLSYTKTTSPTLPNEYSNQSQIALNSGRLVFNTTQDHLLLSSKKTINLNSQEGIYFDTIGDTVIQGPSIYLGDTLDAQSLILGNDLVNLLTDILNDLKSLTNSLQNQVGVPEGVGLSPTSDVAQTINTKIEGYKTRLQNTLSNTSKTV